MKFGVIEDDGTVSNDRFETVDKAVESAKKLVSDSPDTEVEVIQFVKVVSSELKVDVKDVV